MISITYVSSAVFRFDEATLLDLVDQCQASNERLGIFSASSLVCSFMQH